METLNGRAVQLVRLAETTHVMGIGQVGPTIDANSARGLGSLKLTRTDFGVYIEGNGVEFEIPVGNIKVIIYKQAAMKDSK